MKTDMQLHQDVLAELTSDPRLYDCGEEIGVGANHGVVTLAGPVTSYIERLAAERAVERVAGVNAVINKLTVSIPSDGLAHPDGELTNIDRLAWDGEVPKNEVAETDVSQSIKEALKRRANRTASQIIVDAKGGVVSLTGSVPSFADRRAAETAAWSIPGETEVRDAIAVVL
jgi:osmotically-inducible protein OsmY